MTDELKKAIRHIKTRADAWAVKEIVDALEQKEKAEQWVRNIHDKEICPYCGKERWSKE